MLMVKCAKKKRLNALDTTSKSERRPYTAERSVFLSCLESGSQSSKLIRASAASVPILGLPDKTPQYFHPSGYIWAIRCNLPILSYTDTSRLMIQSSLPKNRERNRVLVRGCLPPVHSALQSKASVVHLRHLSSTSCAAVRLRDAIQHQL